MWSGYFQQLNQQSQRNAWLHWQCDNSFQHTVYTHFSADLPTVDIYEDYKHPQLKYTSGRPLELDIFVPTLSLAVEYQGEQHYHSVYPMLDQRAHTNLHKEKQEACKQVQLFVHLLTQ